MAGGEIADLARRLNFAEIPAMPSATLGTVRTTLAHVSGDLSQVAGQVSEEALTLNRTASLFEESQRPRVNPAHGVSYLFGKNVVLPFGQGLLDAMDRLRFVRASSRAAAYVRRTPEAQVGVGSAARIIRVLSAALEFAEGMDAQLASDVRDSRLVGISTDQLLARGAVRGAAQAAGAATGAALGAKIGLLLGSGGGPIGAVAGIVIGRAVGQAAGALIGGKIAERGLDELARRRANRDGDAALRSSTAGVGDKALLEDARARADQAGRGPRDGEECLVYAQRRGAAGTAGGNTGAFNVVFEGNDAKLSWDPVSKAYKPGAALKASVTKLRGIADYSAANIAEGDGLVWDSVTNSIGGGFDRTYGHISVVERVSKDRILVSEANIPMGSSRWNWYERDLLDQPGVYILPRGK